jgi:hypothetical protein
MGLFQEALDNFRTANGLRAINGGPVAPWIPFIKAMAHHGLGDAQASRREFNLGQAELRIGNQNWPPGQYEGSKRLEVEVRALLGE